ncbi:hypothetical protein Ancab_039534 [Ancistrocladus abbreviatus]
MESTLKKYFGYSTFRPYQRDVIEKILEKKDCLVVMATGSGKSLCYQVPPLVAGRTGIVISPLISLMQDQVMALKQRGIRAEYLGTTQTDHGVQTKAECGHFHILFMTPEKARGIPISFWMKLLKVGISLLAVDEAHCISEWGHDFRVEYKQLDRLRDILSDVPFVGLTATATEKVRMDIINSLKMKDPYIAIGTFDRENLFYGVKSFVHGFPFMDKLVKEVSKFVSSASSTIIYCTTVKDAEQIYRSLQEAGMRAGLYHGQMDMNARTESHRLFIRDEFYVMVATVAFGMGIDKPNIRYVIHYGCPKSLESYYQESGRCGRDGIASACWLYYTRSDFAKADFYCRDSLTKTQRTSVMEALMAAERYCLLTTCRRRFLLEHFGEKLAVDNCGNCDNCTTTLRMRDMSREAFLLMACVQSCGGKWGLNMPIDVLRGSRSKKVLDAQFDKLALHGLGKDYSSHWWKALACQLISKGYLKEMVTDIYRTVSVSVKGAQHLSSARPDHQLPLVLPLTCDMMDDEESKSTSGDAGELKSMPTSECERFSEAEAQLYRILLEERMKLARNMGTAPYAICGDQTIERIALTRPSTKARLANIDGVNQHLLIKHGDNFLQAIRELSQRLGLSLDGEGRSQTATARTAYTTPNRQRNLTPAKFEAWRQWTEDGLSIQKIANFPGRAAPIKEQTVLNYLLEAAEEGLKVDWARFCNEIELTHEIFSDVQGAITKVGSTDKLKPIKDELPENVTYPHIKTCLVILKSGVSPQVIPSKQRLAKKAGELDKEPESSLNSLHTCQGKDPCGVEKSANVDRVDNFDHSCSEVNVENVSLLVSQASEPPSLGDNDMFCSKKRLKVDRQENFPEEVTESSLIDWLKTLDDAVALSDIMEHFSGSSEESVCSLLCCLEGSFVIYKKNNLYRLF